MSFRSPNSQQYGLQTIQTRLLCGMESSIPARFYIDPATTAMVTQIVAGVVISIGVALGLFWKKILLAIQNVKIKRTQKRIEKRTGSEH